MINPHAVATCLGDYKKHAIFWANIDADFYRRLRHWATMIELCELNPLIELRLSDAYMRRKFNHHWFK